VELELASGLKQRPAVLASAGARVREAARLDEAIEDRLRAATAGDERAAASAAHFMRRSGAWGLARWGLGRQGMQLWHAMPGLLNVVHEAEDEAAILAGSCRWLREQTRADAAGFVSPRVDRWIASAGFSADDLTSELVRDAAHGDGRTVARESEVVAGAAVRWSGGTSGYVLVRGRASVAEAMADGVRAVAALAAPALRARLDVLALAEAGDSLAPEILGISPAIAEVRLAAVRAALTPFPVLIEGESGTGKELVARALHRLSARRDRRFCAVNCAALTDELVEAELFGHSRGAFTGAVGARIGLFEEAHLGTLFLDEVSELSPRAQAKVLRVLQEREIRRLGENGSRPVDVRIVAATNRPLGNGVVDGRFRHDLMFRLMVVRITLPPLRERPEDVPLLAQTFARRLAPDTGKRIVLGPDALGALARHQWPGNVRELQNAIAALTVLAPERGRVTARHVAQVLTAGAGQDEPVIVPLVVARESLERRLVAASLARHAGRRSAAARELGLSRQGLTKVIKRLGLAHVGRVA
jgi:DNA-binding NtrC family response regulator